MSVESVETDISLLSPIRCGGKIKGYFPHNLRDIEEMQKRIVYDEYVILGGLTNTLVSDDYGGSAIFTDCLKGYSIKGDRIKVKSGEKISRVCGIATYAGLGGLECFCGLPGTVGGAVSGNAGCFGSEVAEFIESVTVFNLDTGETEELTREEIAFGYRYCNLRKNKDLIVAVTFLLYKEDRFRIEEKTAAAKKKRLETQPKGRSLGSFFKKYKGVSAGYYIEQAGMKGYERNGVRVSNEHANFFINEGGDAQNYYELGETVHKKVMEETGVDLKREVIIVGEEDFRRRSDRRTV